MGVLCLAPEGRRSHAPGRGLQFRVPVRTRTATPQPAGQHQGWSGANTCSGTRSAVGHAQDEEPGSCPPRTGPHSACTWLHPKGKGAACPHPTHSPHLTLTPPLGGCWPPRPRLPSTHMRTDTARALPPGPSHRAWATSTPAAVAPETPCFAPTRAHRRSPGASPAPLCNLSPSEAAPWVCPASLCLVV